MGLGLDGVTNYRLGNAGAKGEGRIGPSLIDETVKYERVATEHGEFEVIYGGATGAMQPMGRRFDQDQILKIMAYVETLPKSVEPKHREDLASRSPLGFGQPPDALGSSGLCRRQGRL